MTQSYSRKHKLFWPSCCLFTQGTASFYIFLSFLLISLINHRFLSKGNYINWNLLGTLSASARVFGEWQGRRLRSVAWQSLNHPLEENVRVWKTNRVFVVTSGHTWMEFPSPRCCQRLQARETVALSWRRYSWSVCDALDKQNNSLCLGCFLLQWCTDCSVLSQWLWRLLLCAQASCISLTANSKAEVSASPSAPIWTPNLHKR